MAKKAPTKKEPYVKLERDPKSLSIILSRRGDTNCFRLQFPKAGEDSLARILYEDEDPTDIDAGLHLDYSDVQWLAQALPELLSEMERAGVTE